ncbi:MAG TPA: efflux RND transporter periplasmic adaptor subunit [Rhizomicrobium sp.]|jgi:HlyD family secretion protein
MKTAARVALLVVLAAVAAGFAWWFTHREKPASELTLYGNVDLREVDLAFNNNERIAQVLVTEGDRVRRGQVLARLDTRRLAPQVAQAEANVALDGINLENARLQYQRNAALSRNSGGRGVSRQDVDNAKAGFDAQTARKQADEAQLALLRQQLADAVLAAPSDATVRTRVMEPGEMASPTKPVFSLALTDPKWVRVYASETDLGKIHPGMKAAVYADSFPGRRFQGWVGFISPVAEFTPKSVETEDLRTSLVYEVRVFVHDPADQLRLGMPATVHIPLGANSPGKRTDAQS